jgi:hypothetical protein
MNFDFGNLIENLKLARHLERHLEVLKETHE